MKNNKKSNNKTNDNVYEVETIYKKKIGHNKEPLYFIKWKDWDEKYNSWEPLSNILDYSLIETFEDENRQKQKLLKKYTKKKEINLNKGPLKSSIQNLSRKEVHANKDEIYLNDYLSKEKKSQPKICIKIAINTKSSFLNIDNTEKDKPPKDFMLSENNIIPFQNKDCIQNNLLKKKYTKVSQKEISRKDIFKMKPQKLLSINEYSAIIKLKKKFFKKSKYIKRRSENKILQSLEDNDRGIKNIEKDVKSIYDNKIITNENVDNEKKNSIQLLSENLHSDLNVEYFKFHFDTIVTEVLVNNLSVTIKEMSYNDFINDTCPQKQTLKIPVKSIWGFRLFEKCDMKPDKQRNEEDEIMKSLQSLNKSRSIDSVKSNIVKTTYNMEVNHFKESITQNNITPENTFLPRKFLTEDHAFKKLNLDIVCNQNEEIDMVDLDSCFSRTTVTKESRQTCSESSIIEYGFDSTIQMPPLQAAPWVHFGDVGQNQLPPLTLFSNIFQPASPDTFKLKDKPCIPFSYNHQSMNHSGFYIHTNEERTLDFSSE